MTSIATYSLLATACGVGLLYASTTVDVRQVEVFYGIAATTGTEINYSEPVEVLDIYVRAGDLVDSGQVLMRVTRATKSARLIEEPYRIRELEADRAIDRQRIATKLSLLDAEYRTKTAELRAARTEATAELDYRRRLTETVGGRDRDTAGVGYRPLAARISQLDADLAAAADNYETERAALRTELATAGRPVAEAVSRLEAKAAFDRLQDSAYFEIVAPARGVVGSVDAKPGERKSAFSPLASFYEPSPRQVLSYVHEDRLLDAHVGDSVLVTSLANPASSSRGVVTGTGSRIVDIPTRLRRMPAIETYGREVAVAIPANNGFLQREKVSLTFLVQR